MEIQFGQIVTDNQGNNLPDPAVKGVSLTLARACEIALDTPVEADRNEGLKPKLQRGRLIELILEAATSKDMKPVKLTAEDVSMLKDRIANIFTAASTVRRICKMLDEGTE